MGAKVVTTLFEHASPRAKKARWQLAFSTLVRSMLIIGLIVSVIGGISLLVLKNPIGWTLIGIAAIPYLLLEWWKGELKELSPSKDPVALADVLDQSVLEKLSKNPTVQELAQVLGKTRDAQFFGARFGISPRLIQDIADTEGVELENVLKMAIEKQSQYGAPLLRPGMIVYAFIRQFPQYESLLAHLHIDINDVEEGLIWQSRLSDLIKKHTTKRKTGGIARDWSFGYTPLLSRFGQNISQQVEHGGVLNVELRSHMEVIDQILMTFGSNGAQNMTIVGPTGAGKTTLIHALADSLLDGASKVPANLRYRQIVMLDASSLISAAPGRGQLEDLVTQVLSEAYAAKNIIICLDNAQLFFEEGTGSVNISNVLLPILEAGRLRIIMTMDEQRFLSLSRRTPTLANALNRVNLQPADEDESLEVMQDQLIVLEFKYRVTYTFQSLREAYRLSSRYVHDIAMPGQAIKLLESAAKYSESGLVTINSVQQAIEKTMDIKVSVASEAEDREKLLNLEQKIGERMVGQTRAVSVVSDALRRARAGVRNENRPIGTFLFLGPTGVGKTELAKTLSEVYFGGENKLIRLDLNEYVRSEDVSRLIADGATNPNSLTAQVMKQPYSVILLDEIEKAHSSVLTTLLQLLDEGVLRDINNREVSFRDAIVIATSNAGADRIREYIKRGYKLDQFEDQFVNELIESGQFKPEFLNRFDEIVTFTPLTKENLIQVVDRMIDGVNKTLAVQKVSVHLDDQAKLLLVENGYDPRLGARPMRRMVQKTVENYVAKAVLANDVKPGEVIELTSGDIEDSIGSHRALSN